MRIASAVSLVVIGAILAFAVEVNVPYIDMRLVGYILMGAGLFLMLWQLIVAGRSSVSERRTTFDPNTNSETTTYEQRDEL